MKFKLSVIVAFVGILSSTVHARDFATDRGGDFGAGVALGQPIGATAKFWLSNRAAVDGMAAYHIDDNFDLHSDILFHAFPFKDISGGEMPVYLGIGGRILAGDDTQFGLRFPIGISYLIYASQIELFAEIAPVVKLNGLNGSIDGLVGIRLYKF